MAKDPDDRFATARELMAHLGGRPPEPRNLSRVVGRDAELEALQVHWQEAMAGQGRLVLLTGEGGSGKSALAAEFAASLREKSLTVLQAKRHAGLRPFGLLLALIDSWAARVDALPEARRIAVLACCGGSSRWTLSKRRFYARRPFWG